MKKHTITEHRIPVYNNDVVAAAKKLKKIMFKDGDVQILREKRYYEKPSVKKRRKAKERMNNLRKLHQERFEEIGF